MMDVAIIALGVICSGIYAVNGYVRWKKGNFIGASLWGAVAMALMVMTLLSVVAIF